MMKESFSSVEISIVIPTFNRKEILFYCLKSLLNQTFPRENYEILVIDDGSTEDIETLIKDVNVDSLIRYFRQEKSGQARAENLGIKNAKGEIILFLDNDMIATIKLIEEHFLFHQRYKNYIVRGAYANTSDYVNPEKACEGRFYSTAFFIAGNVSISKNILLNVGMFDEDFKRYGWLDLELGIRLRKIGIKAITNKKAFTYHYQKSFIPEDLPALCHKELERGHTAVLFYSKHPCFRVRMATMNPLVLFFGNIIYKFACNDINKSANIILYLYNKNLDWLLKNIINLVAMAYYSYGVKEALRWKKRNLVIVE